MTRIDTNACNHDGERGRETQQHDEVFGYLNDEDPPPKIDEDLSFSIDGGASALLTDHPRLQRKQTRSDETQRHSSPRQPHDPGAIAVQPSRARLASEESVSSLQFDLSRVSTTGSDREMSDEPPAILAAHIFAEENMEDERIRNEALRDELTKVSNALNEIQSLPTAAPVSQRSTPGSGDQGNPMKLLLLVAAGVSIVLCAGLTCIIVLLSSSSKKNGTSPSEMEGSSCFRDTNELYDAVDIFLLGKGGPDSDLAQRRGWPMNTWCVKNIEDFSFLFSELRNPLAVNFNEDISAWDVSRATNMSRMFRSAESFNGDLSRWVVSNVTDMESLFNTATAFDGDLSAWDVSKVTNMWAMFYNKEVVPDLSTWNVSKVSNFKHTFTLPSAFLSEFTGNVSNWDVSGATTMMAMFKNAGFDGDLSNWDVSRVTNFGAMFQGASRFSGKGVHNWDVSSATNMSRTFNFAINFEGNLSGWDVSKVTDMHAMFQYAGMFNGDLSTWNVSSVIDMSLMFKDAVNFTSDLSSWDVSNNRDFTGQFYGAFSFNQDMCSWGDKMRKDVDVTNMFRQTFCETPENPDLSVEPPGPLCWVCD